MLETIGKFLDSLYETSKSCNEFSIYKFQKEWYENNGYVVLFDNAHHTVFHKAKDNQFDIEQEGEYMKRIEYYKELSNIINGYNNLIRDLKLSKKSTGRKMLLCERTQGYKQIF